MLRRRLLACLCIPVVAARAQGTGLDDSPNHPAKDYQHATALFQAGRRDEAVYWFYRGQLRARIHLMARPNLPPDQDPAAFASLNEVVGRPINEYAFGDITTLLATLDQVLAWHAAEDDPFTPKARYPQAHAAATAGLSRLRDRIVAERASIQAQRRANGLPNRR